MRRIILVLALTALATAGLLAQRGRGGLFGQFFAPTRTAENVKYDGRFRFVRAVYQTLPGGYWYQNQPAWSHGYPTSEQNLMRIADALTTIEPHLDSTNTVTLTDPQLFTYPVLYLIEPSWWDISDGEAMALRQYLAKGGFVIIDDFKTAEWRGGRGWDQFADNMARVNPKAQFLDLDASHPIFHSFFEIESLDIFPQAYNAGRPIFRGLFEDNDPSKRLQMFVAYNTDISQFWEWSERGFRPMAETNEAYKLGVNCLIYGLTH